MYDPSSSYKMSLQPTIETKVYLYPPVLLDPHGLVSNATKFSLNPIGICRHIGSDETQCVEESNHCAWCKSDQECIYKYETERPGRNCDEVDENNSGKCGIL